MMQYMEKLGVQYFEGKHVLELGAGTGLLGIALSLIGADVVITDQGSLVPLMEENVSLNPQCRRIRVCELTW